MDVNGNVRMLLTNSINKNSGSPGLQQTSHVLDAENMSSRPDEFISQLEIVSQGVLGLARVRDVSSVGDGGLHHASSVTHSLHSKLNVGQVVE